MSQVAGVRSQASGRRLPAASEPSAPPEYSAWNLIDYSVSLSYNAGRHSANRVGLRNIRGALLIIADDRRGLSAHASIDTIAEDRCGARPCPGQRDRRRSV